jgi:hypothetical protein
LGPECRNEGKPNALPEHGTLSGINLPWHNSDVQNGLDPIAARAFRERFDGRRAGGRRSFLDGPRPSPAVLQFVQTNVCGDPAQPSTHGGPAVKLVPFSWVASVARAPPRRRATAAAEGPALLSHRGHRCQRRQSRALRRQRDAPSCGAWPRSKLMPASVGNVVDNAQAPPSTRTSCRARRAAGPPAAAGTARPATPWLALFAVLIPARWAAASAVHPMGYSMSAAQNLRLDAYP